MRIEALRRFEGGVETVSTIYLVDSHGTLAGAVPLAKIVLATPDTPMLSLTQEPLISTHARSKEKEVAELFDKYNLSTLPVVDDNKKLTGVITSDDIISLLRANLNKACRWSLVLGRWPKPIVLRYGRRPTTNDGFSVFTYPDFLYAFMLIGRLRDL